MSTAGKGELWRELKDAGVQFDRHYRDYTEAELRAAVIKLRELRDQARAEAEEAAEGDEVQDDVDMAPLAAQVEVPQFERPEPAPKRKYTRRNQPQPEPAYTPQQQQPSFGTPDTMAGLRQNTAVEDEVIRIDENGFAWYQDEIRKPAMPTPRARRVLRYVDSGAKVQTVQNGQYIETFEVAGNQQRQAEVKITLPSYQVGIYRDPRFPFKIHIYNEVRGFDLFEVQAFYGGADLVPTECLRIYVENVLCYDIRTTVRAIEAEARQIDLMKRMP